MVIDISFVFSALVIHSFLSVAGVKGDRYKFMYVVQHLVSLHLRTSNNITQLVIVFSFHRGRSSDLCFYSLEINRNCFDCQVEKGLKRYSVTFI